MFGSEIVDVAIGTIFIFIVVSVICSAVREGLESWLKTRAAYLEHGIRSLLHDPQAEGLARSFYNHPLIFGLFSGDYKPSSTDTESPGMFARGKNLPSYIPSRTFALTLMDLAARGPKTDAANSEPAGPAISLDGIRAGVTKLENPPVQRALLTAIDAAQGDINTVQKNLEAWYDASMDRVSGWYKRSTHWIIFGIAVFITVALNVNAITIADYLYRNSAARSAMVARAQNAGGDSAFLNKNFEEINKELAATTLPIGWSLGWGAPRHGGEPGADGSWNRFFAPLLGWLATAFAATLGAPFWFDILNKVMVIRSTVKPREKSQEEGSEDRPSTTPQRLQRVPSEIAS